jgi:hypothetical protein
VPFKSQAQKAFLFINHPSIAKEFAAATPKGKSLPKYAKKPGKSIAGMLKK